MKLLEESWNAFLKKPRKNPGIPCESHYPQYSISQSIFVVDQFPPSVRFLSTVKTIASRPFRHTGAAASSSSQGVRISLIGQNCHQSVMTTMGGRWLRLRWWQRRRDDGGIDSIIRQFESQIWSAARRHSAHPSSSSSSTWLLPGGNLQTDYKRFANARSHMFVQTRFDGSQPVS